MAAVTLDTTQIYSTQIYSWDGFHRLSAETFALLAVYGPAVYGQNMNAWIDCLTYLRPGDGMSRFALGEGEYLCIILPDHEVFAGRVPEVTGALLSCTAFVNQRSVAGCSPPALALTLL